MRDSSQLVTSNMWDVSAAVEENAAAADLRLSADQLRRIEAAAPKGAAVGDRYADMSMVNR